MQQLFLDNFSLGRLARGLRARQEVLETRGKLEDANTAFMQTAGWTYTPEMSIDALEQITPINELLIMVLEADDKVFYEKSRGTVAPETIAERDKIWEKYEIMRRVVAFEYECLVVTKTEV